MHVLPDTPPGRMSGKRFHNAVFFLLSAVGFVAQDVSEKRRGEQSQPGTSNDSYMWPAEHIPPQMQIPHRKSLLERQSKTAPRVCSLPPPPTHPSLDVKAPPALFFVRLCLCEAARPQRPDQTTCVQLAARNVCLAG